LRLRLVTMLSSSSSRPRHTSDQQHVVAQSIVCAPGLRRHRRSHRAMMRSSRHYVYDQASRTATEANELALAHSRIDCAARRQTNPNIDNQTIPIAKRSRNTTLASTPSNLPNLHAHMPNTTQRRQQLRLLPSCNATTRATTTRPATTRTPPRRGSAQPVKNTRRTPANQARVLKHHNAHTVSERTSAETAQHTPPTHAGASSPCPSSSPRAPTRRPPTQAAKAAISKINHHNKRRNDATTHTSSRQRSTTQRSSLVGVVVFLGGMSRDS
jgi:hypothetical protein